MSIYLTSKVSCVKCRKEYSIKGIHTHFDRTHGDIETKNKYSSGNNGKYDQIKNNYQDRYEQNPSFCLECNKKLPFKQKHNKFCSHSCSAKSANRKRSELGWVPTFEQRKKTSETLTGKKYFPPVQITSKCPCGTSFSWEKRREEENKKYCSYSCSAKYAPSNVERRRLLREQRSNFENYRKDCAFNFDIKCFHDEFDIHLLEEHGWYKPKNRGDNLHGVSRDHMFSIKKGFVLGIDPKIIAHPANCRLLPHLENVSKGTKCSITLEELLKRIEKWDLKYNT